MSSIFRYDNPVMVFFQKAGELLVLNILWLLCCIPIVTIGASTAAMYQVCLDRARKNEKPLWNFWKYFRSNFRQATIIWLLMALWGVLLAYDWYFLFHIEASALRTVGIVFAVIVSAVYLFVLTFVFPLQANFQNSIANTIKNALLLSFANPLGSAALAAFCAIPLLLILFTDAGICLLLIDAAPVAMGSAFFFSKIFDLFTPDPQESGSE